MEQFTGLSIYYIMEADWTWQLPCNFHNSVERGAESGVTCKGLNKHLCGYVSSYFVKQICAQWEVRVEPSSEGKYLHFIPEQGYNSQSERIDLVIDLVISS